MRTPKTSPYLIEILKAGQWLVVGSSRSEAAAHRTGETARRQVNAQEYRVVKR